MRAIFVRESESFEYLKQRNIGANLFQMADPGFVMDAVEPLTGKIGCQVYQGTIGLNLSPLMAKYVTAGDMDAWGRLGMKIVQSIIETTGNSVLLIPNVTCVHTNDHAFLTCIANLCSEAQIGNVSCLAGNLSAAEIKWVISKCAVFAGSRTHSTIAAISSGVPTLTLAYSRKARGLNQDIFGGQMYCLQPADISPSNIARRIGDLLAQSSAIVDHLARLLPGIRGSALHSGAILRRLIENR